VLVVHQRETWQDEEDETTRIFIEARLTDLLRPSQAQASVLSALADELVRLRACNTRRTTWSIVLGPGNGGWPGITDSALLSLLMFGGSSTNAAGAIMTLAGQLGWQPLNDNASHQQQLLNALLAMNKFATDIESDARTLLGRAVPVGAGLPPDAVWWTQQVEDSVLEHDPTIAAPFADAILLTVARTIRFEQVSGRLMETDELLGLLRSEVEQVPTAEALFTSAEARGELRRKMLGILERAKFSEVAQTLIKLVELKDEIVVYCESAAATDPFARKAHKWQAEEEGFGPALGTVSSESSRGDLGMLAGTLAEFRQKMVDHAAAHADRLGPLLEYVKEHAADWTADPERGFEIQFDRVYVVSGFKILMQLVSNDNSSRRCRFMRTLEFAW